MSRGEAIDIKKLRYVLYARKSTEDENRQVRSIDDQIKDCTKLAKDLGITVVEVVKETKSAKKPEQRVLFTKMLKDLEAGKYDGILCWHPDRLCRNMLEGGRIINMLDEAALKDIRFHSHQFSNDANGKMLLGMLFVFSKQYSDDLSDKVSRGVQGNLEEGKSAGAPKFGYDRSKVTGYYEPNKFNGLIKNAWELRLEGKSLQDITKYLNDNGFYKITNTKYPKKISPKLSAVANMFRDSFYCGLLVQVNQTVDLKELSNFRPVITEQEFYKVQALGYSRTQDKNAKKRVTFYPLRHQVFCAVCNGPNHMLVGKNKSSSGTHYLTYRCNNPDCTRKPKSFRAKHIFKSIQETLDKLQLSDEAYDKYCEELNALTDEKLVDIKKDILSKRGVASQLKSEFETRALSLGTMDKNSIVYKTNESRANELSRQHLKLLHSIELLAEKIKNPNRIKLNKNEFLNLVKTASDKMKAGSETEKDALCQILFLNLRVDNEKVASYLWNEPFASLVKATELSSGGGGRN